jgi:hypothetical protein
MLRKAVRFLPVLLIGALGAFAQGNFAHWTYGGGYTATFTLVNQDALDPAPASLYLFNDDGSAATVPILINGTAAPTASPYNFTIPANGAISIVVPDPGTPAAPWGWAQVVTTGVGGPVNGQLNFRRASGGSAPATETVVPLSGTGSSAYCLPIYAPSPVTIIPFDNTAPHGTAIALANTTANALTLNFEFDDQSGNVLSTYANVKLPADANFPALFAQPGMPAMSHTAWDMPSTYKETASKAGTLKITWTSSNSSVVPQSSDIAIIALFYTSANTLTTVLPITQ